MIIIKIPRAPLILSRLLLPLPHLKEQIPLNHQTAHNQNHQTAVHNQAAKLKTAARHRMKAPVRHKNMTLVHNKDIVSIA